MNAPKLVFILLWSLKRQRQISISPPAWKKDYSLYNIYPINAEKPYHLLDLFCCFSLKVKKSKGGRKRGGPSKIARLAILF